MVDLCPKVPKQDNSSDCGVYLLQYVESFLKVSKDINKFLIQLPACNQITRKAKTQEMLQVIKKEKKNGTTDNPDIGVSK